MFFLKLFSFNFVQIYWVFLTVKKGLQVANQSMSSDLLGIFFTQVSGWQGNIVFSEGVRVWFFKRGSPGDVDVIFRAYMGCSGPCMGCTCWEKWVPTFLLFLFVCFLVLLRGVFRLRCLCCPGMTAIPIFLFWNGNSRLRFQILFVCIITIIIIIIITSLPYIMGTK